MAHPVCGFLSFFLAPLLILQGQDAPKLNIVILDGEGAINNVKQRTAREPVVQVEDENHKPVAGAAVFFELPQSGAGGTFAQGARTATFITDQNGRATAQGFRPNAIKGRFQIKVTASSHGQTSVTSITQNNAAVAAAGAAATGISLKLILILAAAGAAVAGGVYAATHNGGATKPPTTITPGSPSVGGPR
jgi:hypothetical protein